MILISRDRLPRNAQDIDRALQEYFPFEFIPRWSLRGSWVAVALQPLPDLDMYVDPRLTGVIREWLPGDDVGDIATASRMFGNRRVHLLDSWTLLSWSRWLSRQTGYGKALRQLVVLHVDDHDDLMPPRIVMNSDGMKDAITGKHVALEDPTSVEGAIRSGAIGMGSFLLPLLWSLPRVQLRHLAADTAPVPASALRVASMPDTLLAPRLPRLSAEVGGDPGSGHTYRRTSDPHEWLDCLPECPVLLHIDMDYFNNRYDADSDWRRHHRIHDPSVGEVEAMVDALFDALDQSRAPSLTQDVSIAVSPGFFPAELWAPIVDRVVERLAAYPSDCLR